MLFSAPAGPLRNAVYLTDKTWLSDFMLPVAVSHLYFK